MLTKLWSWLKSLFAYTDWRREQVLKIHADMQKVLDDAIEREELIHVQHTLTLVPPPEDLDNVKSLLDELAQEKEDQKIIDRVDRLKAELKKCLDKLQPPSKKISEKEEEKS